MQFEFSSAIPDPASLAAALHRLDPRAQVTLDAAHGRLEVFSTASREQVGHLLAQLGFPARALDGEVHISGGSTCCGGCS